MSYLKDHLVLIVDDEPDLREMLIFELESLKTKTLEAKNGKEGLVFVKKEKIDIVISDIRMPGGNGIEFLEATKKINIKKPIFLFITAFSDVTREELYAKGADGLISKPFDLPSLLETLEWFSMPIQERYAIKPNFEVKNELKINQDPNEAIPFLMGRGGALFPTGKHLYEVGSFVNFYITFTSGESIVGIGEVLWNGSTKISGEYCAGVEFRYFNDETRNYAISVLENCSLVEYVPERKEKFDN